MIRGTLRLHLFRRRHSANFSGSASSSANVSQPYSVELVEANFEEKTAKATCCSVAGTSTKNDSFVVALPPPNVTGKLHLGHALTVAIQDSIVRFQRLKGKQTTWIPGFDHAGIATQVVVEKQLWKERKLRRSDISKEEFLAYCHQWKDSRVADISGQLKRLGATLDWNHLYYTMDERFSKAVTEAFCLLHDAGLITRDKRLVNWCPTLRSTISDQEVDNIAIDCPTTLSIPNGRTVECGYMHKIRFNVVNHPGLRIIVATTRPETTLADVAIAVNPSDSRYSHLIGQRVEHPITHRLLPIIGDKQVQADKGTGALKVTPAHDFVDFAIARRHDLPLDVTCIDEAGVITDAIPSEFAGLDRFEAREMIVKRLIVSGKYDGRTEHVGGTVPVCSRTGDIIEPMLKEQWFLDTREIGAEAIRAVERGDIKLHPELFFQHWRHWLSNEEPWCLSRQLLWGHPIPAYKMDNVWKTARSDEQARKAFAAGPSDVIGKDPDVLDTWFSSALAPLVVAGWPDKPVRSPPLHLMETGHDILGFWVTRMVMLCHKLTGQVPFSQVLLHGMVRDSSGRKMSKSLGNVVDPMYVIQGVSLEKMLDQLKDSTLSEQEKGLASSDIKKRFPDGIRAFGADALRFALLRHNVTALDVNLDVAVSTAECSKFANKLTNLVNYAQIVWNACLPVALETSEALNHAKLSDAADRWILSRLTHMVEAVDANMKKYSLHVATGAVYDFCFSELCDVYLETTKSALYVKNMDRLAEIGVVLKTVLRSTLSCLSPFMPFLADHLYQRVEEGASVFEQPFPRVSYADPELDKKMELAIAIVSSVRSWKKEAQVPNKGELTGILHADIQHIQEVYGVIERLCFLRIEETKEINAPAGQGYLPLSVQGFEAKLSIKDDGKMRVAFIDRLKRQLAHVKERKAKFETILANCQSYADTANLKNYMFEKNQKNISMATHKLKGVSFELAKLEKLLYDAENGADLVAEQKSSAKN
uniref:valine--tRNA ligase n=1 Tax=Plectus sambesii TaxID=2011161 RepID=A0A914WZV3_9BILA